MSIEYRDVSGPVGLRDSGGAPPVIRGYAAVFDQWTTLYEDAHVVIRERIRPGAFARAIRERQDVRALFNHDPRLLLGRTLSGTCRLTVESHGLAYEVDMSDTTIGRDCLIFIRRRDVTGSSFGFRIRPGGQAVTRSMDRGTNRRLIERDVMDLDLFDVSPVTYPAYQGTEVGVRQGREPLDAARLARMEKLRREIDEASRSAS